MFAVDAIDAVYLRDVKLVAILRRKVGTVDRDYRDQFRVSALQGRRIFVHWPNEPMGEMKRLGSNLPVKLDPRGH